MLEAGGWWDNTTDSTMLTLAVRSRRVAVRRTPDRPFGEFDACIGGLGDRRRAVHEGRGHQVRLVARAHARRAHQSLGAHLAALRARRLQAQEHRRPRRRLADLATTTSRRTTTAWTTLRRRSSAVAESLPQPSGRHVPPGAAGRAATSCSSSRRRDKLGIWCIPSRLSIITKPLNGRCACHYCGQCNRGCMTNSNFSSPNVLLIPAHEDRAADASSPTRWRAR